MPTKPKFLNGTRLILPDQPKILEPKTVQLADDLRSQFLAEVNREWKIMLAALPPPDNEALHWVKHVKITKKEGGHDIVITPKLVIKQGYE